MAVKRETIRKAIEAIAGIQGLYMDDAAVVEDVALLSHAFPDEDDYMAACASTQRALRQLTNQEVASSDLKYGFAEWKSYHYQHRVGQGVRATCRVMYREVDGGIEVKGFGHRRIPSDFYERMADIKR